LLSDLIKRFKETGYDGQSSRPFPVLADGTGLKQYVEYEAWQNIETVKKALAKLENGQAKFAEHEEVAQWLAGWGTDQEKEPPQCR
jgi:predicted transcriptional regulator